MRKQSLKKIRRNSYIDLGELCKDFNIALFDNSSLWGILERDYKFKKGELGEAYLRKEKDILLYFYKNISNFSQIYLTEKIFKEGREKEKKKRKPVGLKRFKGHNPHTKYQNAKHSVKKIKKRFLKEIKNKNRIIILEDCEKKLYNEFFYKHKNLVKQNDLSVPDYDFLITGVVLSLKRKNTAIVTNDFPLLRSYELIIKERKISPTRCGAFIHAKQGLFLKYRI